MNKVDITTDFFDSYMAQTHGLFKFFRTVDLAYIDSQVLLYIHSRLYELKGRSDTEGFINLVRDEFINRRQIKLSKENMDLQIKLHQENRKLSRYAIAAAIVAGGSTLAQAIFAWLTL